MGWRAMFRPGMRAYIVPLLAGLALSASSFLPWVVVGRDRVPGFPDTAAIWTVALGLAAAVLASLSLITRKNSRHPLLLVGLAALGIEVLSWRIMPRTLADRALTRQQAVAIVEDRQVGEPPHVFAGSGLYLGVMASAVIVGFGMTIVLRRAAKPYSVADPNDDV